MKHVATKGERDKPVIEAVVRRFGPISRVGIHELTHLRSSVISGLVRQLLQEGRLIEVGLADNPMGRKQILLRLNEQRGFIAGIGFDDENVLAGIMDLRPKLRSFVRQSTRLDKGTDGLVGQLLEITREAIRQAGVESKSLLGIGLAGSGLVNSRTGTFVMSSTIGFLKQVPLQQIVEKEFGIPTLVENITRAKTVAERTLGTGMMADDMIYVEYGRTGIGAGIILDGRLVHGSGHAAGEFGHTHLVEGGPACRCGSFGCLEATAGASALEARIRTALSEGGNSEALALAEGDVSRISGWTVLEAADKGDKTCGAIVEQLGNCLGLGLANLVNLFNPSTLVLDRRLGMAGQGLLDQIGKVVRRQALSHSTEELTIRFGQLGDEASVLGAGSIALEKHFEIPALKPPRFMIESIKTPWRRNAVECNVGAKGSPAQPVPAPDHSASPRKHGTSGPSFPV